MGGGGPGGGHACWVSGGKMVSMTGKERVGPGDKNSLFSFFYTYRVNFCRDVCLLEVLLILLSLRV